jgi:hypothetical protein
MNLISEGALAEGMKALARTPVLREPTPVSSGPGIDRFATELTCYPPADPPPFAPASGLLSSQRAGLFACEVL